MQNYSSHPHAPAFQREQDAAELIDVRPALVRWRVIAVLALVLFIGVNALLGTVLFQVVGAVSITVYGLVVLARKIVQITFARMSNYRTRRIVRQPIVDALVEEYPHLRQAAQHILGKPSHFPDFKQRIMALLEDWYDNAILHEGDEDPFVSDVPPGVVRMQWVERKWRDLMVRSFYGDGQPPRWVGLVVPTFKTSALELQRLIESLEDQTYPFIRVSIILNENNEELKAFTYRIIKKYGGGRYVRFVEPKQGKRNAMRVGFADFLDDPDPVEYIFNVDSDSRLHPDAIANAVRLMESDPHIGCITGNIKVANADMNLLTNLTYQRFFYAFDVERAAQNLWYSVTCMSGAFMGVRADLMRYILKPWSTQKFLGQACNYGDDRHLATLTLKLGLKSAYSPDSLSYTDVPHEMSVWKKQQTRWARSAWRETLITLPWVHKLPLWIVFETAYLLLFPFILWGIIASIIYRAAVNGPQLLVPYLIVVFLVNFIFYSCYAVLSTREFRFVSSPLYLLYQFRYLQPLRLWALISLDQTKWGTK